MCDYSLHNVSARPAVIGEELISTRFSVTSTRGFASADAPDTAVCLRPGTELAFESEAQCERPFWLRLLFGPRNLKHTLARFRQINIHDPDRHHDAVEFPNGKRVLLTNLLEGQRVRVLQLPYSEVSTAPSNVAPREPAVR
jgi:hypothetical protein